MCFDLLLACRAPRGPLLLSGSWGRETTPPASACNLQGSPTSQSRPFAEKISRRGIDLTDFLQRRVATPAPPGAAPQPCSSIRIRQGNATAPTHQNASHSVSATEFLSVESLVTNRSKCYEPGNTIQSNRGENEPSSRAEM